jgi:predicted kinase
MPTLHLMVGLPGSGKTTLAKKLEQELPAMRLTPDEWMARVVGDGYDEAKRAIVEAMLWDIAAQGLRLGINVILDFGFWSRVEREDYRARAAKLGADMKVHFLDVSLEELVQRLTARNAALPQDTFHIEPTDLEAWSVLFEPPKSDELE